MNGLLFFGLRFELFSVCLTVSQTPARLIAGSRPGNRSNACLKKEHPKTKRLGHQKTLDLEHGCSLAPLDDGGELYLSTYATA